MEVVSNEDGSPLALLSVLEGRSVTLIPTVGCRGKALRWERGWGIGGNKKEAGVVGAQGVRR